MHKEEEKYTIDQFAEWLKGRIDAWAQAFKGGREHAGCYPIRSAQTRRGWTRTLISILMAETGVTQREIDDDAQDPLTSTNERK